MNRIEEIRKAAKCVYLACEKPVADDISAKLNWAADELDARGQRIAELERVYEAALGLTLGVDWNNGTQALKHGYRQKLIDAVNAVGGPKE